MADLTPEQLAEQLKAEKERLAAEKDRAEAAKTRAEQQDKFNKLKEAEAKLEERIATYKKETVDEYAAILKGEEESILLAQKKYDIESIRLKELEKYAEQLGEISAADQEHIDRLKEQVATYKKLAAGGEDVRKGLNDIGQSADHVASKFFGINGKVKDFAKGLKRAGNPIAYLKDQMKLVGKNLTKANINAALMLNLYEKSAAAAKKLAGWTIGPVLEAVDLSSAMDRAIKRQDTFRLASRDVGNRTVEDMEAYKEKMLRLGMATDGTTEDMIRINKELFHSSNLFRELKNKADPAREELEKMAQSLERRFNIAIVDTSKLTNTLAQTFGYSAGEAADFSAQLALLANNMGLDVTTVFNDFGAQANNLAKFGLPDLQGQFLELKKVSQMTGISMDAMVGSMEKFTTFEGALTAASKMNAVFGSTIDGLSLMDTVMEEGPIKGFIKLRQEMESNGIEMDNLNYAQMRSLQDSLGLTAEQIRQFGSASAEEMEAVAAGTMDATLAAKQLQEGRKEGQTTEELMQETMSDVATSMDKMAVATEKQTRSMLQMSKTAKLVAGAFKIIGGLFGAWMLGKIAQLILKNTLLSASYTKVAASAATSAAAQQASAAAGGAGGAVGKMGMLKSLGGGAMKIAGPIAAAAAGAYAGHKINEAIYGEGNVDYDLFGSNVFAPGDNFISAPKIGTVGDVGTENITSRTQRALKAGDKITREPGGGTTSPVELKLTVNLMTKEGKALDTLNLVEELVPGAKIGKMVAAYLDEKLNLNFG